MSEATSAASGSGENRPLPRVTMVAAVLMLGLAALWAAEHVVPERLTPWLSLIAGGMILLMGLWMLLGRRAGHGCADRGLAGQCGGLL